jgi:hypothetical protein
MNVKKSYATITEIQEGNKVPYDAQFSISGMPIKKSTLGKDIQSDLQKILLEDVMRADNIDQVGIIKKLAIIEKKIYTSIMDKKETKYYKPVSIASMNSYKAPMSTSGIKQSLIYNEMRDAGTPAINLDERNNILIIKTDITKKNIDKIKDLYPEKYDKLLKVLNSSLSDGKSIDSIAIPLDTPVPDWVLPFVDFNTIINDSLKNFPLEAIGLSRKENDYVNYSNIIKL